jgi:ABC-type antimicrobial peptide transport system permease subunit
MRAEDTDVRITPSGQMNVGPAFFSTVGQQLIAGRTFSSSDGDSTRKVVIIDQRLARRLFERAHAVGRRVLIGGAASAQPYEVVGVVADARVTSPRQGAGMVAYFPYSQSRNLSRLCLVVRVAGNAGDVATRVRAELRTRAPSLPILRIDTADEQLDDALFRDRMIANVVLFFAVVAMLLACMGLYGLTAYTTARRTNEVGVRVALGATSADVLFLVLGRSLGIVAAGVVLGIGVSLMANQFINSRLYGVGAFDARTLFGSAILLVVVTGIASLVPAHRATRLDPVRALRTE